MKSDKDVLNVNIPIDKMKQGKLKEWIKKVCSVVVNFLILINPYLLAVGAILAFIAFFVWGGIINIAAGVINLLFLAGNGYMSFKERTSWGVVEDQKGNCLPGVQIGLYDRAYDKLLDKRVTDEKGKYQFVIPGGLYVIKPIGKKYMIDDPKNQGGYLVGKKQKGSLLIAKKLVVRVV